MTRSPITASTASRGSVLKSCASIADSAAASSGTSTSARNPSLPRFTPSTGNRCPSASRMARSMVPSPPMLTSRSARCAQLLGGHRGGAAGQPGQLGVDAEDLDPALIGPVEHRGHRPAAVPLRMQQQPDDVHAPHVTGPLRRGRIRSYTAREPGGKVHDGQSRASRRRHRGGYVRQSAGQRRVRHDDVGDGRGLRAAERGPQRPGRDPDRRRRTGLHGRRRPEGPARPAGRGRLRGRRPARRPTPAGTPGGRSSRSTTATSR